MFEKHFNNPHCVNNAVENKHQDGNNLQRATAEFYEPIFDFAVSVKYLRERQHKQCSTDCEQENKCIKNYIHYHNQIALNNLKIFCAARSHALTVWLRLAPSALAHALAPLGGQTLSAPRNQTPQSLFQQAKNLIKIHFAVSSLVVLH